MCEFTSADKLMELEIQGVGSCPMGMLDPNSGSLGKSSLCA